MIIVPRVFPTPQVPSAWSLQLRNFRGAVLVSKPCRLLNLLLDFRRVSHSLASVAVAVDVST